ncbi:MAG TPA: YceI family protein [Polyangiaceae bacterium]
MTLSTSPVSAQQTAIQPARWTIDPAHSSVGFSVRHMMITNVRGEFSSFSGEVSYDPKKPEAASISASIDVASLSTREPKRDEHLRSADFFNAEAYPTLTFRSKRVARAGDDRLQVVGDLTIAGTTREVTLDVRDVTSPHTDPWGQRRIGAAARTKVRRSEFGMQWNSALEAGGVLVGDEVTIDIEVSLVAATAS